ncbi:MAG TPA: SCO family protein, partial [Verrucomicrobiae bacterium]
MKIPSILLLLLTLPMPCLARPAPLSDEQLLGIKFDQKLGTQVSLDLCFRDETGKSVRLGELSDKKPTVLMLGYYGCPMLCSLVLNGATDCFRSLKKSLGNEFTVIFVSIDPMETPATAAAKKASYLRAYGGSNNGSTWHFLTGDDATIKTLAQEVGFHYAYDPASRQFAHPSGLVLLTPEGRVAHYFFGVSFSPEAVEKALQTASLETTSATTSLNLLCFHYAPIIGKYGHLVVAILRYSGVLTVMALA